jgi:hypothetical protein
MQEFFQIQQEENQSVSSFYEHVIRKCKKSKKFIMEQQVICRKNKKPFIG